jgi:hypothetical protein
MRHESTLHSRHRVLVLGGLSFDTIVYLDAFPRPAAQTLKARGFHDTIGATGAGKALNLRKLGFDVTFHALLGTRLDWEREGIHFLREREGARNAPKWQPDGCDPGEELDHPDPARTGPGHRSAASRGGILAV